MCTPSNYTRKLILEIQPWNQKIIGFFHKDATKDSLHWPKIKQQRCTPAGHYNICFYVRFIVCPGLRYLVSTIFNLHTCKHIPLLISERHYDCVYAKVRVALVPTGRRWLTLSLARLFIGIKVLGDQQTTEDGSHAAILSSVTNPPKLKIMLILEEIIIL